MILYKGFDFVVLLPGLLSSDQVTLPVEKAYNTGVSCSVEGYDDPIFFKLSHIDFHATRELARGLAKNGK